MRKIIQARLKVNFALWHTKNSLTAEDEMLDTKDPLIGTYCDIVQIHYAVL